MAPRRNTSRTPSRRQTSEQRSRQRANISASRQRLRAAGARGRQGKVKNRSRGGAGSGASGSAPSAVRQASRSTGAQERRNALLSAAGLTSRDLRRDTYSSDRLPSRVVGTANTAAGQRAIREVVGARSRAYNRRIKRLLGRVSEDERFAARRDRNLTAYFIRESRRGTTGADRRAANAEARVTAFNSRRGTAQFLRQGQWAGINALQREVQRRDDQRRYGRTFY